MTAPYIECFLNFLAFGPIFAPLNFKKPIFFQNIWYGMVWFGMVRNGLVWFDMVWTWVWQSNQLIIYILKINVLDMVRCIEYLILWLKIRKICKIIVVFMSVGWLSSCRRPIFSKKSPKKGWLPKKKSIWRENVPTRGEGVPKKIKNSLLKIHFYLELFQGGEGVKSLFHISFQNIFLVKMALNVWKWWIISPLDPRCDLSTSWEQFWIVLNQNY